MRKYQENEVFLLGLLSVHVDHHTGLKMLCHFFRLIPVFHRAVVLPLETMLLSEFDRDCSFTTGSAGGDRNGI